MVQESQLITEPEEASKQYKDLLKRRLHKCNEISSDWNKLYCIYCIYFIMLNAFHGMLRLPSDCQSQFGVDLSKLQHNMMSVQIVPLQDLFCQNRQEVIK